MKFKNTTSSAIEQIPKEDSIVVTTDTSLVGYCANNQLHKVNKPEWQLMDEPNIGLIKDGILNQIYANKLEFGSNNGARTCKAYQAADAYRLSCDSLLELAWIRWKVDFDDINHVYVNSQKIAGYGLINFRISDTAYDPSVAAYNIPTYEDYKKLYTEKLSSGEVTVDVSKYNGVHWLYMFTNPSDAGTFSLFDIDLRKSTN